MGKKRVVTKTVTGSIAPKTLKIPKIKRKIEEGIVYILSSYNNTIITLTDKNGDVIYQSSAGKVGFSGTRKATPYAASKVAEAVAEVINALGIKQVEARVKGIGVGRESALRSLAAKNVNIVALKDITPIPHNGVRPPKTRRV